MLSAAVRCLRSLQDRSYNSRATVVVLAHCGNIAAAPQGHAGSPMTVVISAEHRRPGRPCKRDVHDTCTTRQLLDICHISRIPVGC